MAIRFVLAGLVLAGLPATALIAAPDAAPAAAEADDRHVFEGALDISAIHVSTPFTTWLDEGEGKLRFDESDSALQFSRAFLEYRGRLTSTVLAHGVLNIADTKEQTLDLTEAYLEWRPVPSTPWRVRSRLGAFYPRLSLENVGAGWSSPYSLSSSAINTWIGEELRTFGAEVRVSRALPQLPLTPEVAFEGAMFYFNDPTGELLNRRGWAIHDRQTGISSELPLPEVSAIEPWDTVSEYSAGFEPFKEIDHRAGFYAGSELRLGESFRLKYVHYDNHGNPEAESGENYAWQTRFNHVGMEFTLPGDVGVIGQWVHGITRMGPNLGPWRVWDSVFEARYLLLTRAFGRHRLSARYDNFDVQPTNDPEQYTNQDHGYAWTASYLFDWSDHIRLGVEYLAIATEHCRLQSPDEQCAWVSSGLPRTSRQNQVQLSLRWQL